MNPYYADVITRFLRDDERLIHSEEKEMPLVIEAGAQKSTAFLQQFLRDNSAQLTQDLAHYGAVLFRGFAINSDEEFEQTLLSIPGFHGIKEAFMAENGRVHVGNLQFVLHTNSVYKTGGTLYLGGFHTENYYSPDVPGYISFFCQKPSALGGETGLINTEKLYAELSGGLQKRLEQHAYFVGKWRVSEAVQRYQVSPAYVEELCAHFHLPVVDQGKERFILMYKPSVFVHPLTQKKALQINLFELPTLNNKLRRCFMNDYQGREWFWHRFFWKLPPLVFHMVESLAVMMIALFKSPKTACMKISNSLAAFKARQKKEGTLFDTRNVGSCFNAQEVNDLAQSMRKHYCSCLWQKGDILLVDNRKVMHAGMPGKGERVIRAMIANPIQMSYHAAQQGCIEAQERTSAALGAVISTTNQDLGKSKESLGTTAKPEKAF